MSRTKFYGVLIAVGLVAVVAVSAGRHQAAKRHPVPAGSHQPTQSATPGRKR